MNSINLFLSWYIVGALFKSSSLRFLQCPNILAGTSSKGLINVLNFKILSPNIFIAAISIISDVFGF